MSEEEAQSGDESEKEKLERRSAKRFEMRISMARY